MTAPEGSDQLVSDWVRFDSDRVVTVFTGRVELGQGNLTALLQMAADELCLDPGRYYAGACRHRPHPGRRLYGGQHVNLGGWYGAAPGDLGSAGAGFGRSCAAFECRGLRRSRSMPVRS